MSTSLESSAEILKLARLLGVDEADLAFLGELPAGDLRAFRESATDVLFDTGRHLLAKVGAAAKLLPSPLVATIAQRAFGPLLCARAAGAVDPAKAVDVAKRLPADFLADTTIELDPRRVAAIISRVPSDLAVGVARVLGERREFVTMGRFLAFVPDDTVAAAIGALDDEVLLRTAFVLEHKDRLDHTLGLLPPERLPGILRCAAELGLWPEALDLLDHLSDVRRGPIAEVVAEQEPGVVEGLVAAVSERGIWENLIPIIGLMSDQGRRRIVTMPPFHEERIMTEIVESAIHGGLWVDLVPVLGILLDEVDADLVDRVVPVVTALDLPTMTRVVSDAVASAELLMPLIDLVARMTPDQRAGVLTVIDSADRETGEMLVATVTDPDHMRLVLDALPEDLFAAIETNAQRLGLSAELEKALVDSGARAVP